MLLSDLNLPISYEEAKKHALVFSSELAEELKNLHHFYGNQNLVPQPVGLNDGRVMLCGDILTETQSGGLLSEVWDHIDHETIDSQIEVIPWEEAIKMLSKNENV